MTDTQHPLADALRWYARENSWRSCGMHMSGRTQFSAAEIDRGERARKALAQYEKSDTDRDQLASLRNDLSLALAHEQVATCEGCSAPLMDCDDYVSGEDCSGCWAAMTDAPSKRERPCYAYRVGKPSAALASKTAIDPATVGTSNCDGLEDHFPTGLRSKLGVTKDTLRWYSDGVIQCECECGASFTGTDEQEVRQHWAEHTLAAIRALGKDQ